MTLRLDDPALYAREVHTLAARKKRDNWRATTELRAPLLAPHAERIAAMLAKEVSRGAYAFAPLEPRRALLNGKVRTIYRLDPLDAVVWGVLTRVLMANMEPRLGSHIYSYRKGKSQWSACRAFLRYLRRHVKAHPDPRTRGVHVLRRDVRRYDETIPVGPDSTLWSTLRELRNGADLGFRGDLDAFIVQAFRPPVVQPDGSIRPLDKGVATGLPTQTVACNTYLLPLDRELLALKGGFYARFGDDILFAHPDEGTARHAEELLERGAKRLSLTFGADKSQAYWLTVPGREHPSAHFVAASRISYLGFDVGFDGARLRNDKRRAMWRALRTRLDHTERLLTGASTKERADVLCSVVRTAFDRRSPLSERYAPWLRFDVMSRADLTALDHHIALEVAQRLSGVRGVRAFRAWPPARLRNDHGLPSLVRLWDQARHHKERAS